MWHQNSSPTFLSESQIIKPLNPTWNARSRSDRESYHQRQLQHLQALGATLSPPPLELGALTPSQEDQVKRLRRLVTERPPISSVPRRRSQPRSRRVTQRPARNRIRRPRKRVRKRPPHPGMRLFLELMARYGWVCCCGTWIILVISGGLAGKALMSPDHATTYSASYDTPASELEHQSADDIWVLSGAIGLGGAGLSWLLSQLLESDR